MPAAISSVDSSGGIGLIPRPEKLAPCSKDRRVDGLGGHRGDVDAGLAGELATQALGESADRILADDVGGDLRGADPPPDRGHGDQHAGAAFAKVPQGRAGTVDLSHQVGLDHLPEHVRRDLEELAVGDHPGAVDPDVDAAEARDRGGRERLDGSFVGDVQRFGVDRGSGRLALPRDIEERLGGAATEGEGAAATGNPQRRGAPDPARGAGDHHRRLLERHGHQGFNRALFLGGLAAALARGRTWSRVRHVPLGGVRQSALGNARSRGFPRRARRASERA